MKRTRSTIVLALTLITALMFSACSSGTSSSSSAASNKSSTASSSSTSAKYVLKLGYGGAVDNPRNVCATAFAKWVNEQTNGEVKIDCYPGETIGTDEEMGQMCSMGTLDMTINAVGVTSKYAPKLAALGLPFLFSSYDKVDKVLDSDLGESLVSDLPSKGLHFLAYWENGLRQITNSKRPITTPADLKGLKIRTPNDEMTLSIFKTLGASPSPLAFSELYLALSQHTYDGQENPIENIYSSKLYEVQKYISITNHKYEPLVFVVSEKVWEKLPADVQKVISEGAEKFGKEHRTQVREREDKLIDVMKSDGVQVNTPNLTAFKEQTKSVYTQYESKLGKDLVDKIVAAAQ